MIGGMIWPLVEAATSIAPALTAGMPMRRMTGMVNVPVVTTLAIDDPEIIPVMPEARIDGLGRTAAEAPDQGERERRGSTARPRPCRAGRRTGRTGTRS